MSDGYIHPTNEVTLTYQTAYVPASGVTTINIPAAYVDGIYTHTGGSIVFINGDYMWGQYRKVYVTETPAAIAALTQAHILVTPQDTTKPPFYLAIGRFTADSITAHTGGAKIIYLQGNKKASILVTETPAAIIAAVNAAVEAAGRTTGSLVATGTNRATAATVVSDISLVSDTAPGQGIVLPAAILGLRKSIFSNGPDSVRLYADGSDTIEGVAGATGILLGAGSSIDIECVVAGSWRLAATYAIDAFIEDIYDIARTARHLTFTGTQITAGLPIDAGANNITTTGELNAGTAFVGGFPAMKQVDFFYDFSVQGGAQGPIALKDQAGDDIPIPLNSYIVWGYYDVISALTSGTSTAEISLGVATDDAAGLLAATVITSSGTTGLKALVPDMAIANFTTKTTASRNPIMTISVEDLTAGRLVGTLYFVTTF